MISLYILQGITKYFARAKDTMPLSLGPKVFLVVGKPVTTILSRPFPVSRCMSKAVTWMNADMVHRACQMPDSATNGVSSRNNQALVFHHGEADTPCLQPDIRNWCMQMTNESHLPCAISDWYGVYCVYQPGFSRMFLWMTGGRYVL